MNTIEIPKQEIYDILEDENTIKIKEGAGKHDCHIETYVCKKDDKFYTFSISVSYQEGIQLYTDFITATEVKPIKKTIIDWVPV